MKKLLSIIMVMCTISLTAQKPFIGVSQTNRGISLQVGYPVKSFNIKAAYRVSLFRSSEIPFIYNLSLAKPFKFKKGFIVSPEVGAAKYYAEDFTKFNEMYDYKIIRVNEFRLIYGMEIGKNNITKNKTVYQIFISGHYCKEFWFGAGAKLFIVKMTNLAPNKNYK